MYRVGLFAKLASISTLMKKMTVCLNLTGGKSESIPKPVASSSTLHSGRGISERKVSVQISREILAVDLFHVKCRIILGKNFCGLD